MTLQRLLHKMAGYLHHLQMELEGYFHPVEAWEVLSTPLSISTCVYVYLNGCKGCKMSKS